MLGYNLSYLDVVMLTSILLLNVAVLTLVWFFELLETRVVKLNVIRFTVSFIH